MILRYTSPCVYGVSLVRIGVLPFDTVSPRAPRCVSYSVTMNDSMVESHGHFGQQQTHDLAGSSSNLGIGDAVAVDAHKYATKDR